MRKILYLTILVLLTLSFACFGCTKTEKEETSSSNKANTKSAACFGCNGCDKTKEKSASTNENTLIDTVIAPSVLMIIASNGFHDGEYEEPRKVMEEANAKVIVASSSLKEAIGMLGMKVKPDTLLKDSKASDYDIIIFVGGSGSTEYWEDIEAHRIINEALEQNKILGAICLAPVTLANAGALKGKKATVYEMEESIKALETGGVICTGKSIEVSGNIITANGPSAAKSFGEALLKEYKKH